MVSGINLEELAGEMNQRFIEFTKEKLIPIFEGNETLKNLYLPDDDGKVKEIFPVIGFYEGVTERYIVKIDNSFLKGYQTELQRITEAIQNSEFGNSQE